MVTVSTNASSSSSSSSSSFVQRWTSLFSLAFFVSSVAFVLSFKKKKKERKRKKNPTTKDERKREGEIDLNEERKKISKSPWSNVLFFFFAFLGHNT